MSLTHGLREVAAAEIAKLDGLKKRFITECNFGNGQKTYFLSESALKNMLARLESLKQSGMNGFIFSHGVEDLPEDCGGTSVVTIAQIVEIQEKLNLKGELEYSIQSKDNEMAYVSFEGTGGNPTQPPVLTCPPSNICQ